MKTVRLTGTSEVLVFEPRPEPVPPGASGVRLSERVPMVATVKFQKRPSGVYIKATWYTHEYGMTGPESFKQREVSIVVDRLKVSGHKDMFENPWVDVTGSGKAASCTFNTPDAETWERLFVTFRFDGRPVYDGKVEFEIMQLDVDSQAAMRQFVAGLGQLELGGMNV
ncbi:MAG: hypothetical protein WBO55_02625 [Rhizobiaceae bacterium]